MPERKINLIKGDRVADDTQYRDALPQNALPMLKPVFDVDGFMVTHPGWYDWGTQPAPGKSRGAVYNDRFFKHFRVSGQQLIDVATNGNYDELGFIANSNLFGFMSSLPYSFNSQAIITNRQMWLWDPDNGLQEIVDDDLGNPIDGCWIAGYYLLTDGQFLYHTELNEDPPSDPQNFIQPQKYATSEFSPDLTLGVEKTQDNQAMVFNRYTTEFFQVTNQEGFVFARIQGKAVNYGIVGTYAKTEMDGRWYVVGSSKNEQPSVAILTAGRAIRISTREIDTILAGYTEGQMRLVKMDSRMQDNNQFIYVYLYDRVLVYNHTVGEKLGKEFAWSAMAPNWLTTDLILDPRVGNQAWIGANPVLNTLNRIDEEIASRGGEEAETIVYTPFVKIPKMSVNILGIEVLPGRSDGETRVFVSVSYDGVSYSKEWSQLYSEGLGDNNRNFIIRCPTGFVNDWVGFKLRIVSSNKVALASMTLEYS